MLVIMGFSGCMFLLVVPCLYLYVEQKLHPTIVIKVD